MEGITRNFLSMSRTHDDDDGKRDHGKRKSRVRNGHFSDLLPRLTSILHPERIREIRAIQKGAVASCDLERRQSRLKGIVV